MKTTIELPDELFRRAKAAAAMRGMTLKEFFTRAAERELKRLRTAQSSSAPSWHALLRKPTASERKDLERIDEIIESEFSGIDEESWK